MSTRRHGAADEVSRVLGAKRSELEVALGVLSAPPDSTADISFGKRVGDGTAMAVERYANVAVHDRLRATLADVVRAQEKLVEGDYGRCDRCRKAIAPARLEALPWATACISCAG